MVWQVRLSKKMEKKSKALPQAIQELFVPANARDCQLWPRKRRLAQLFKTWGGPTSLPPQKGKTLLCGDLGSKK
jgi:hypothetical protein